MLEEHSETITNTTSVFLFDSFVDHFRQIFFILYIQDVHDHADIMLVLCLTTLLGQQRDVESREGANEHGGG